MALTMTLIPVHAGHLVVRTSDIVNGAVTRAKLRWNDVWGSAAETFVFPVDEGVNSFELWVRRLAAGWRGAGLRRDVGDLLTLRRERHLSPVVDRFPVGRLRLEPALPG